MPLSKLEHLFSDSQIRKYDKSQVLAYPGDKLTHIYFVRKGYLKMYTINEQGDNRVFLLFQPKTAFPIVPKAVDWQTYTLKYFYQAMTPLEVFKISCERFYSALEKHPDAAQLVLNYLTELSGEVIGRLGVIENKDTKNKILSVLCYLIKVGGEELRPHQYKLRFSITHQDIASLAGVTRESSSIALKQLENDKVISQKKDKRLLINEQLMPTRA